MGRGETLGKKCLEDSRHILYGDLSGDATCSVFLPCELTRTCVPLSPSHLISDKSNQFPSYPSDPLPETDILSFVFSWPLYTWSAELKWEGGLSFCEYPYTHTHTDIHVRAGSYVQYVHEKGKLQENGRSRRIKLQADTWRVQQPSRYRLHPLRCSHRPTLPIFTLSLLLYILSWLQFLLPPGDRLSYAVPSTFLLAASLFIRANWLRERTREKTMSISSNFLLSLYNTVNLLRRNLRKYFFNDRIHKQEDKKRRASRFYINCGVAFKKENTDEREKEKIYRRVRMTILPKFLGDRGSMLRNLRNYIYSVANSRVRKLRIPRTIIPLLIHLIHTWVSKRQHNFMYKKKGTIKVLNIIIIF